jgi:hypothetical protein
VRPGKLDLIITRNVTWTAITLTCRDAAGDPLDLTGYTPLADARRALNKAVAFSLACELGEDTGTIILTEISDTDTSTMTLGEFTWDLVMEAPDGKREGPWMAGRIVVEDINTRLP